MMDLSKEYIKMCEAAIEIQKSHKPEGGDFIFITKGSYVLGAYEIDSEYHPGEVATIEYQNNPELKNGEYCDFIYLPRQDQLQEMLKDEYKVGNLIENFYHYVFGGETEIVGLTNKIKKRNLESFDTLEQLWLAFVMDLKFDKHWNGEVWT